MHIKCDWKLLFVTVIASVSLIKFSPMDHESRSLDEAEKYRYKKIVIGLEFKTIKNLVIDTSDETVVSG